MIELWTSLFQIVDDNQWSRLFQIPLNEDAPQVDSVVASSEWLLCSVCSLTATALFMIAANRIRQGDSLGACLTGIGALIIALAPHIASFFEISIQ